MMTALHILDLIARQDSIAEAAAKAGWALQSPMSRTGDTNPDRKIDLATLQRPLNLISSRRSVPLSLQSRCAGNVDSFVLSA